MKLILEQHSYSEKLDVHAPDLQTPGPCKSDLVRYRFFGELSFYSLSLFLNCMLLGSVSYQTPCISYFMTLPAVDHYYIVLPVEWQDHIFVHAGKQHLEIMMNDL